VLLPYLGFAWNCEKKSIADKWVFGVEKCAEKCVSLDNLLILAEFVLCLPGSNASVECIFSLTNIYWKDEENRASLSLVKAVLIVKTHFGLYTWIHNQTQLLSEIHGSEKYKTQNVD
jgi:hypothetical protein